MKQYLEIGKIVSVQGIKGEVRVEPWCDSPEFLCGFKRLYLDGGENPVAIAAARAHKNMVIMSITGVDTVEQAQDLRGKVLYMDRKDAKLPEDSYFVQDLTGLRVFDIDNGGEIGVLADVTRTGANDVYHIKSESGKIFLIPAIPDVVKEIDIENGILKIHILEGLI